MHGYLLQNSNDEYLKTLDTAEGKIEFTKESSEARNYAGRPGGGQWDAENEKQYLDFHFGEEYGERVTSLRCVFREWENSNNDEEDLTPQEEDLNPQAVLN